MASYYQKLIIEVTNCTEAEAPKVERLMRDTYPTLDGLSRYKFVQEARLCLTALRCEPSLARLL